MTAYYNEFEPYAAEWLRNLIKAGLIPDGEVDTRSIVDVSADDLRSFTQCHFFAGIGGWAYALRLAGWSDDRPIWTGSCPCQPFSVAGKGLGADDPRHLWPHFFRLIRASRPPVVMGEQVAGAAGYGWFDGVAADLESEDYASRAVDIPACSVDAPHIRSRLYWVASDVADATSGGCQSVEGREPARVQQEVARSPERGQQSRDHEPSALRNGSDVANAQIIRREERERKDGQQDAGSCTQGRVDVAGVDEGHMDDADDARLEGQRRYGDGRSGWADEAGSTPAAGGSDVADADHERCDGIDALLRQGEGGRVTGDIHEASGRRPADSFWSEHIWLTGADGKARRAEPTIPLLAHGIPARVGRLRAYGNAIVPQVAAEVIAAYMEATQ